MHKLLIIISILFSSLNLRNSSFIKIDKIECNYFKDRKINLDFYFNSDKNKEYKVDVIIDLYNDKGNLVKGFRNSINIKGKNKSKATLDELYKSGYYLLISAYYDKQVIVSKLKFNLLENEDCNLNKDNLSCNQVYKSVYQDGIIKEEYSSFKVIEGNFDKLLVSNFLDLSKFKVYSLADLKDYEIYLKINNKIKEFDLVYNDGYLFTLNSNQTNNFYDFSLLEDYYLSLNPFKFKEEYNINDQLVKNIYFPFNKELKEYNCSLIIKGYTNIKIDFNIYCKDNLFGDCINSKYCLGRYKYA